MDDPQEVYDRLDALSRQRALTNAESRELARAIKALDSRTARVKKERRAEDRLICCLDILKRAAAAGATCPTNGDIADMLGLSSTATASGLVALLETAGHIKVERGRTSRVVTIVATGQRTAVRTVTIKGGWTDNDDAVLMDAIADGAAFADIAKALHRSKSACISRFHRLAAEMGSQAA